MSAPIFLHVYENGEVFAGTNGALDPPTHSKLVSSFKISALVPLRKVTTLSGAVDGGFPNNKRAPLAAEGGTGPHGNRFKLTEIT